MISGGFGKPLVEQYETIDVRRLARRGVLRGGEASVFQHGREFAVEWTRCNYGGARPWFLCPGCRQRAAILYAPDLLCRACYGLAYQSQREDTHGRAWLRVERLRARLRARGIDPTERAIAPPLRVMRAKVYCRLLSEYTEAERRARAVGMGALEALVASHQRWEAEYERRFALYKEKERKRRGTP